MARIAPSQSHALWRARTSQPPLGRRAPLDEHLRRPDPFQVGLAGQGPTRVAQAPSRRPDAADEDVRFIEAQMAGTTPAGPLVSRSGNSRASGWIRMVARTPQGARACSPTGIRAPPIPPRPSHRYYTAAQITGLAWSDAALFPEEVRNYVLRVRKVLARLEILVIWSIGQAEAIH